MTRSTTLLVGVLVCALVGLGYLYQRHRAPPACTSDQALNSVSLTLRETYHVSSVLLNNIKTVSSGFFGGSYVCSAEAADIRSDVTASDMHWREIRYQTSRRPGSGLTTINVTMGNDVPLAPETPSFWARLKAYL